MAIAVRPVVRRMRALRMITAALAASLVLTGCGGDDSDEVAVDLPAAAAIVENPSTGAASADPAAKSGENTLLPDVQVIQVATGKSAPLRSLAPAGKPMLLWFWAPHCTFCRAEAPELLAFEKAYGDKIQILGLGAQDDLDQAVDFLADTSTQDLEMVWDKAGETWLHFKVTNQPTVLVIGADGKVSKKWFRDFDADAILKAAGLAAAGPA